MSICKATHFLHCINNIEKKERPDNISGICGANVKTKFSLKATSWRTPSHPCINVNSINTFHLENE